MKNLEATAARPACEMRSPGETFPWLPFSHWNLRRNPFGELRREERMELAFAETEPWVDWLRKPHRALQFIAPCGFGKSTHLLAMIRDLRLSPHVYVYLAERGWCDRFQPPPWPQGRWLVLDETQRLPRRRRRAVLGDYTNVILGTHCDIASDLVAAGFHVRSIRIEQTDAERIAAILNRRIRAARLSGGEVPQLNKSDAEKLVARFGANVRAIESYLFERFQQYAGAADGEVQFVD